MRKIILFVLFLAISISWISYAYNEFTYNNALDLANQYIKNSSYDENWKDSNPRIENKWVEYHTDDENKVSYIEFKVVCDKEPNCWFIMVNFDWDDVAVPIASTSWNTPSEFLNQGTKKEKYYYFWPYNLYSENLLNWDVQAFNPNEQVILSENIQNYLLKTFNEEKKQLLKYNFKKAKEIVKDFKKSNEFKKQKEEIKDYILNTGEENKISYNFLPIAKADLPDPSNTYVSPWSSDIFIPWSNTSDCWSRVPCYNQFTSRYNPPAPFNPGYCYSGCSPTAIAILYWYYDRNGLSNLIVWTAPSAWTDSVVRNLVSSIRLQIWTTCQWNSKIWSYEWSTVRSRVKDAIQYAKNRGYNGSLSYYYWNLSYSSVFSNIKSEIDLWRPILVHINDALWNWEHTAIAYWYKSYPSWSNIVRMNMWWGNCKKDTYWNCILMYSTMDQHLWAISYGWINNRVAAAVTKYIIKH